MFLLLYTNPLLSYHIFPKKSSDFAAKVRTNIQKTPIFDEKATQASWQTRELRRLFLIDRGHGIICVYFFNHADELDNLFRFYEQFRSLSERFV